MHSSNINNILLSGFTGTPLPYLAANDEIINIVLLVCFFSASFVLATGRRMLTNLFDNFKSSSPHAPIFTTITNQEVNSLLLLFLQTAVILGVLIYIFLSKQTDVLPENLNTIETISIIAGIFITYLFVKWVFYSSIGWVFSEGKKTTVWIESYSLIIYLIGLLLYPIALLTVYFNPPINIVIYILLGFFIAQKGLILYKGVKLFSKNLWGHMLLILYFCALEIIPCLLLYKCISNNINVLTFNI